jgi:asparagine synthetase B (glutamine-hydrolysing)
MGVINLDGKSIDKSIIPDVKVLVDKQFNILNELNDSKYIGNAFFSITSTAIQQEDKDVLIYEYENLILIGDIRIDNKKELSSMYNYDFQDDTKDEIIMLKLYHRYGFKFIQSIVGEFSTIIFDKSKNNIFAVRDHIGIKTLFWTVKENNVWITTDLFLFEDIIGESELNESYFKEFYSSNGIVDSHQTPYTNIFRIPSAHYIKFDRNNISQEKYWDLKDVKDFITYKNESDYEETFLDLVKQSVKCRLVENNFNAIMMSGGLDSTTIFALSKIVSKDNADTIVKPVCGVFEKYIECDETKYIRPVLEKYMECEIFENCDEYGVFKNFPNDAPWTYEPCVNSASYTLTKSLAQRARNEGAVNILSGYAADHILGGSVGVIPDLVKKVKLHSLISECYNLSKKSRQSFFKLMLNIGILPLFGKGWLSELNTGVNEITLKNIQSISSFNQKDFYKQFSGTKARLFSDRVIGPITGIEFQHPFLDRRLIEFLYRIPGNLRWEKGTTKVLLRKSMKNYLPKEILRRTNKTVHLAITFDGLRECWSTLYPVLKEARIEQFGFISKSDWNKEIINWRQGVKIREDFWTLLTMELWLFKYSNFKLNHTNLCK